MLLLVQRTRSSKYKEYTFLDETRESEKMTGRVDIIINLGRPMRKLWRGGCSGFKVPRQFITTGKSGIPTDGNCPPVGALQMSSSCINGSRIIDVSQRTPPTKLHHGVDPSVTRQNGLWPWNSMRSVA
ncbi:hypothetical protein PM082_003903 [Marasmius tenuissimus]|nr:hypothetical protein PM082_003903 [Marasmius tenuissimus]